MGKKTAVLLKSFRAAKCLTLLKVVTSRIKVVRNKRSASAKQMRAEIAQLIKSGQDATVYVTKADALIKQENLVAVYDLLDHYCRAIMGRFPAIELQRTCPADMKEPIASVMYAAEKCPELTELPAIKDAFVAKYGKEFAAAATELRPNCGVSTQVIELLSAQPAKGDKKLKLMKDICVEYKVDWQPGENLAVSAATTTFGVGVSEAGPSTSTPPEANLKHGASGKVGLAEAVMATKAGNEVLFATDVAKPSEQKQSPLPGGTATEVVKDSAFISSIPSTKASSKASVIESNAFEEIDAQTNEFEEEDARRLRARILQSLKGGSFADQEPEGDAEPELTTQDSLKPSTSPTGMIDSDSDSFVSVEDGRLDDESEHSLIGTASGKEMLQENSNQNLTEGDPRYPTFSQTLSVNSQEGVILAASKKTYDDGPTECNLSRVNPNSLLKETSLKVNAEKLSNIEQNLSEEERENSLRLDKFVRAQPIEKLGDKTFVDDKVDASWRMRSESSTTVGEMVQGKKGDNSMQFMQEMNEDSYIDTEGVDQVPVELSNVDESGGKQCLEEELIEEDAKILSEKQSTEVCFVRVKNTDGASDESFLHSNDLLLNADNAILEVEALQNNTKECLYESTLPPSETSKNQSIPKDFNDEISLAVCKEPLRSPQNPLEAGITTSGNVTNEGARVEELVGTAMLSALAALNNREDLSAAAKAIAVEAAELAVRDYVNKVSESNSVAFSAAELSKVGVTIGEKKVAQAKSFFSTESHIDHLMSETSIATEEKPVKVETALNLDEANKSTGDVDQHFQPTTILKSDPTKRVDEAHEDDPLYVSQMGAKIKDDNFGLKLADHATDVNAMKPNVSTTVKPKHEQEFENINPFATSETNGDGFRNADSTYPKTDDIGRQRHTTQATEFGHDDHLNVFFQRKMPQMFEDNLRFDEENYSYSKLKPSFGQEKVPLVKSLTVKTTLLENVFSKPVFETSTNVQNAVFEDNSRSSESAELQNRDDSLFKSPIFDEVPELDDMAVPSDGGLDNLSTGFSDRRPQSSWNHGKSFASFDPEPEPFFDDVVNDEEKFMKESTELPSEGQLKWVSKKSTKFAEHEVMGSFKDSVTSEDVSGKPISRRSRRPSKRHVNNEDNEDSIDQHSRRGDVLRMDKIEQEKNDMDSGWPNTSTSSTLTHSKGMTGKEYNGTPSVVDGYHSRTKLSSLGTSLTSTRPANKQTMRDEDFYFPDENDMSESLAGSRPSRIIRVSPPRQPVGHVYGGLKDDIAVKKDGYKREDIRPGIPKNQWQIVEDDHTEDFHRQYNQSSKYSELSKLPSGGHGYDGRQGQHYQPDLGIGTEYKNYGYDEVSGFSPLSSKQHEKYPEDDDYKSHKSKITNANQWEEKSDEGPQQMGVKYHRKKESESLRTRPMPSRLPQSLEEERHGMSMHATRIQDPDSLNLQNLSESMSFKSERMKEGNEVEDAFEAETVDPGRMPSASVGFARKHQQHGQDREDVLGSTSVHHEKGAVRVNRMPVRDKFNAPKLFDSQDEQELFTVVKSSPSRPLSSRVQPKQHSEEMDTTPKPSSEEKYQISHQSKQDGGKVFDGNEMDLRFGKQNPGSGGSDSGEVFRPSVQPLVSRSSLNSRVKEELFEDGDAQYLSSRLHKHEQREEKDSNLYDKPHEKEKEKWRYLSRPSLERKEEQDEHLHEPSISMDGRKQELRSEDRLSKLDHKDSDKQQDEVTSGCEGRQTPNEVPGDQRKVGAVYVPPSLGQQTGADEPEAGGNTHKLGLQSQPFIQQKSPSTNSLEVEISDPVILATIPPPVRKAPTPKSSPVKLESSASDPPKLKPAEVKMTQVPKKAPNVDDLAANFEALRRARRGE